MAISSFPSQVEREAENRGRTMTARHLQLKEMECLLSELLRDVAGTIIITITTTVICKL
jgi:hypothetical protein